MTSPDPVGSEKPSTCLGCGMPVGKAHADDCPYARSRRVNSMQTRIAPARESAQRAGEGEGGERAKPWPPHSGQRVGPGVLGVLPSEGEVTQPDDARAKRLDPHMLAWHVSDSELTPEAERVYDSLYDIAEDAKSSGLPLPAALQAIKDGYSSAEADAEID